MEGLNWLKLKSKFIVRLKRKKKIGGKELQAQKFNCEFGSYDSEFE